jgi:hypothetical protein
VAGAPVVMTLAVTLCSLLSAIAAVARASAMLAATIRTLPSIVALARLLLLLLLREKQLAVYARWWQCAILHDAILHRAQPAAGIF